MKKWTFCLLALILFGGCKTANRRSPAFSSRQISGVLAGMTDLMVHDVTNPPLAARFFSYACLAGYEVVAQHNKEYRSMHYLLRDYPLLEKADSIEGYSVHLAALLAMLETAQKMQPSGRLLQGYESRLLDSCKRLGMEEGVIQNSRRYAAAVSKQVLAFAKKDRYNRISNFARYTPRQEEGAWYPTPPAYFAAVEPHFNTVRPFTLDTCSQFPPLPPVAFSRHKDSPFYKMMLLNYRHALTEEQKEIAAFWDCNPFAVQDNGHLLVGLKKISPGAHWMGIAGIACIKEKKSFEASMQVLTLVAIGLMDSFISCWDEKYRSHRIRPETAIRRYIDPDWHPLIQTPPFPEYSSGHSVVSAASATILTHFFGENYAYTDTIETRFGLPPRSFASFQLAAREAAMSRFYGGIHFMDAIDNGYRQGEQVGAWVIRKFQTSERSLAGTQNR